jgi:protocatechuate 4,5-dioxygenase alpha subunit
MPLMSLVLLCETLVRQVKLVLEDLFCFDFRIPDGVALTSFQLSRKRLEIMAKESGHTDHIPGTFVFTGQRSQQGLKLNRFAYSLHKAENREAYKQDPIGYMDSHGLTAWEKQKVADKDLKALVEEGGGSIYMLMKIGAITGDGLASIGAQQRGETKEEFLKTRNVRLRQNT